MYLYNTVILNFKTIHNVRLVLFLIFDLFIVKNYILYRIIPNVCMYYLTTKNITVSRFLSLSIQWLLSYANKRICLFEFQRRLEKNVNLKKEAVFAVSLSFSISRSTSLIPFAVFRLFVQCRPIFVLFAPLLFLGRKAQTNTLCQAQSPTILIRCWLSLIIKARVIFRGTDHPACLFKDAQSTEKRENGGGECEFSRNIMISYATVEAKNNYIASEDSATVCSDGNQSCRLLLHEKRHELAVRKLGSSIWTNLSSWMRRCNVWQTELYQRRLKRQSTLNSNINPARNICTC